MIDLGLLEQQAPPVRRVRTKTDLIKPFQDVADLRGTQGMNDQRAFELGRSQHDADLADSYREALKTHDPQDLGQIAGLREQGFGPESIPLGENESTRQEKEKENKANLDLKATIAAQTAAYENGRLQNQAELNAIRDRQLNEPKPMDPYKAYLIAKGQEDAAAKKDAQKTKIEGAKAVISGGVDKLNDLSSKAQDILNNPALANAYGNGPLGATKAWLHRNIPGTPEKDLMNQIETLGNTSALDVYGAMKSNGVSFGRLTNMEAQMLKNYLAPLNGSNSLEQTKKSLQAIIDFAKKSKGRIADTYKNEYGEDLGLDDGSEAPPTPQPTNAPVAAPSSAPAPDVLKSAGDLVYGKGGDVDKALEHIKKHKKAQ